MEDRGVNNRYELRDEALLELVSMVSMSLSALMLL
jgi:hypothetical protein